MSRIAAALAFLTLLLLTGAASAAEVAPGGALNITVSGFARFLAAFGNLDDNPQLENLGNLRLTPAARAAGLNFGSPLSRFDFLNDYQLDVTARGRNETTGVEYGGLIRLVGDTNFFSNSSQEWLFARGAFGEFRFGDAYSAANDLKVGSYTIAVGTGGPEGTVVDMPIATSVDFLNFNNGSGALVSTGSSITVNREAEINTKVIYFTPVFAGFQAGISYEPNSNSTGDNIASRADRLTLIPGTNPSGVSNPSGLNDVVSGGISYFGGFGGLAFRASLVGAIDPHHADTTRIIYGGTLLDFHGFQLAGGLGDKRLEQRGLDLDQQLWNIGVAYHYKNYAASVTFARTAIRSGRFALSGQSLHNHDDDLVFGLEVGLMPGVVLSTEVAHFSVDLPVQFSPLIATNYDGWDGVTRLAIAF